MSITLEQAEIAVKAAKEKAVEIGTLMNISIVDAGANLTAFACMIRFTAYCHSDGPVNRTPETVNQLFL